MRLLRACHVDHVIDIYIPEKLLDCSGKTQKFLHDIRMRKRRDKNGVIIYRETGRAKCATEYR